MAERSKARPDYPVSISGAARATGVSAKMIRHYEAVGLLPKARRSGNGYRTYGEQDVHVLNFVRVTRDLGFPLRQIEELLGLWADRRRASSRVKALALRQIEAIESKVRELQSMKRAIEALVARCHGDARPEGPILDGLAQPRSLLADTGAGAPPRAAGHPGHAVRRPSVRIPRT